MDTHRVKSPTSTPTDDLLNKLLEANMLEQVGNTSKARVLYEEIIAQEPTGVYAPSAQKALENMGIAPIVPSTLVSVLEPLPVKEKPGQSLPFPQQDPLFPQPGTKQPDQSAQSELVKEQRHRSVPLRLILIAPFVVQIFAAVGLTGYLSIRNGEKAVNDLASRLRQEVSARVDQQLTSYLEKPWMANRLVADAIDRQQLNVDLERTYLQRDRFFLQTLQLFNGISGIYIGTPQRGAFLGAQHDEKEIRIGSVNRSTGYTRVDFSVDEQGQRTQSYRYKAYDARIRPWFKKAVQAKKPVWTEIYNDFVSKELNITATQPIFDRQGKLVAVSGVDLFFSAINPFLKSIPLGKSGQIFIIERDANIVASSTDEKPFIVTQANQPPQRLPATSSTQPEIKFATQFLQQKYSRLSAINASTQEEFYLQGKRQFLQVTPFKDQYGLDWLIVVVVPESEFMEQINANTRTTIFLSILALVIAVISGIYTSRWILGPIARLNQASQDIARGNLDQEIKPEYIQELNRLGQAFNRMSNQLRDSFQSLEARVDQRTQELKEARDAANDSKTVLQQGAVNLLLQIDGARQGNLTVNALVSEGVVGSIADAFNATIRSLKQIVIQVQSVTNEVSQLAQRSETSVRQLSADALTQSSELTHALASVVEMSSSIQRVSQSTQEVAEIARRAAEAAQLGDTAVDQTVVSMDKIRTAVSNTAKQGKRLAEASQEISQILEIITGISEKANLLAFNASIEAARAGEQGQGFRQVAEEVRGLAQQVAESAQDIEQLISGIQQETAEMLNTMELGTTEVVTGTQLVSQTRQTLRRLNALSQQINHYMQDVSTNTIEQAAASHQVNETMEVVAGIAATTSNEAKTVTSSLKELLTEVQTLQTSVAQFRLE